MFGTTSLRPISREFRMTPFLFEKQEGCQKWPLKSPCATRHLRCSRTRSDREGRKARRDVLTKGIPMFTKENKTPQAGDAGGADETIKAINLNSHATKPASKALLAKADQVIGTFPFIMTRERKSDAKRQVLRLFLEALAASCQEQAV